MWIKCSEKNSLVHTLFIKLFRKAEVVKGDQVASTEFVTAVGNIIALTSLVELISVGFNVDNIFALCLLVVNY